MVNVLQEKLGSLKQNLTVQRRNRLYEAYLWESGSALIPDDPSLRGHSLSEYNNESRVFEDPLYLMQYNLLWQDPQDSRAVSVENSAFMTAENEVYLRKVRHSGGYIGLPVTRWFIST